MSEKVEKRKNTILRATFKAVADNGFDAVTLQDIANYAKVSKGIINYYFGNKEDVFCQLLDMLTGQIHDFEREEINRNEGALNKLQAYVNAAFRSPKENRKFYTVYLDFLAHANHNNTFREINLNFYNNCWELGKIIIESGKREGIFSNIETEEASKMIRSMIDGCLIQWLMINDDEFHEYYKNICYESLVHALTNKSADVVSNL